MGEFLEAKCLLSGRLLVRVNMLVCLLKYTLIIQFFNLLG